jgi:hypothetical protein
MMQFADTNKWEEENYMQNVYSLSLDIAIYRT